jgi:hypothetical protein
MRAILFSSVLVLASCPPSAVREKQCPTDSSRVSVLRVLANPQLFEGCSIGLIGVLDVDEATTLYVSYDDQGHHNFINSVFLDARTVYDTSSRQWALVPRSISAASGDLATVNCRFSAERVAGASGSCLDQEDLRVVRKFENSK